MKNWIKQNLFLTTKNYKDLQSVPFFLYFFVASISIIYIKMYQLIPMTLFLLFISFLDTDKSSNKVIAGSSIILLVLMLLSIFL